MPTTPTTSLATRRPDLRDTLMEFDLAGDQAGFVGLRIAPVLEVEKDAGSYPVIKLKELLKSRSTRRAPDGSYAQGEGEGGKDSYETEEHGFKERVDDSEAKMFGDWWDAEQLATERCVDAVLRSHNQRVIDASLGIANSGAASAKWDVHASADPVGDLLAARVAIRNATGVIPNAMVIDWEAFQHLQQCANIIDRLKSSGHTDPKKITAADLAVTLDLEEIIISGSLKNTANEAKAAVLASMWDKTKVLVFRKAATRNLKAPQFMRTFHWGSDGSVIGGVIESYRDEDRRSDLVRCRMATDEKIVYSDVARIITTVM